MRKKIIRISKSSVGITLNPTVLAYLGINSQDACDYTLDLSFKDNSLILKNPIKEKKEKE